MTKVGKIIELWRYPVSSLRGERLEEAALDAHGIVGDRRWGLFDVEAGKVAAPEKEKRWRVAPEMQSRLVDDAVEVLADDGVWRAVGTPEAASAATEILGFPVEFRRYEDPFPKGETAASAPRYDRAHLHVLTTASLARLASLAPADVQVDVRRFRANMVIETEPELEGFIEKEWLNRSLAIGSARAIVVEPCERCSFVALAQGGLPFAPPVLHTIARHGGGGFGIQVNVTTPGALRVGDEVVLA
ncbi:MOSC N-terminal beta barrel domain-containing protein [Mesorhizobium sp. YR577]|uniref:MOSC domain-containing protein n=1 Tax=Mesorhizobium sp. YR577 TaxID=1884373 RepID=UPI0008E105A8|nr:MOSC N-terminal beta barrel domain-containing protein [Mesorhizobium sp. YR577]SFU20583.1 hypothetical protein SAMN05518861_1245 [Mesorhizobium sp. YR577]